MQSSLVSIIHLDIMMNDVLFEAGKISNTPAHYKYHCIILSPKLIEGIVILVLTSQPLPPSSVIKHPAQYKNSSTQQKHSNPKPEMGIDLQQPPMSLVIPKTPALSSKIPPLLEK